MICFGIWAIIYGGDTVLKLAIFDHDMTTIHMMGDSSYAIAIMGAFNYAYPAKHEGLPLVSCSLMNNNLL